MTYSEAIKAGYTDADEKYTRGYISRYTIPEIQPVHVAGGRRKGQLYVMLPCFHSSQYCVRRYLKKEGQP